MTLAKDYRGTILEWDQVRGNGVIQSDQNGLKFYAHIRAFVGVCACGHKHKCEIQQGMRVEFVSVIAGRRNGPLPAAMHITVKDDTHAPGV